MLLQADADALFTNQAVHQTVALCYFIDTLACLTESITDFVDEVLRQPGDGLRRRGKHNVFTNYDHRF